MTKGTLDAQPKLARSKTVHKPGTSNVENKPATATRSTRVRSAIKEGARQADQHRDHIDVVRVEGKSRTKKSVPAIRATYAAPRKASKRLPEASVARLRGEDFERQAEMLAKPIGQLAAEYEAKQDQTKPSSSAIKSYNFGYESGYETGREDQRVRTEHHAAALAKEERKIRFWQCFTLFAVGLSIGLVVR